ncbi:MAG: PKD domain-containing protein [Myxococcota bacterium]
MNRTSFLAGTVLLLWAACRPDDPDKESGGGTGADASCSGPSLELAPEDQSTTTGSIVALSAKGKICNCDGDATLTWAVENAPVDSEIDTGDLNVNDPENVSFTPDVPGTYVLSVTVTDSCGNSSNAELVIVNVTSSNSPPVADCGDNLVAEADQRVDFDGSASRDPEGAELEYSWAVSSVPDCSAVQPGTEAMFNGGTSTPSMVPDCAGVFVVALVVSDGEQWSEADYCSVTVASGDEIPIADAGASATESACAPHDYELNGYGSYDPEGQELTYQWTVVSVPSGSGAGDDDFSDATAPNPTFSWDVVGTYTFQLQVYDGANYSAPDIVNLTFVDESENSPPIANAGEDQTIDEEAECETASYEWTCEDCAPVEFDLDGSASDDPVDGDDLDFYWADPSEELTFGSAYSAITTATTPSFPSEYGAATTHTWEVELSVSDCADTDTDRVQLTYTCTGEYSP